jgi:uncharacterized protein (TIGR02996 family)
MIEDLRAKLPPIEAGFIEAIMTDPYNDAERHVYADWLEEQNDRRCEYLRLECEFADAVSKTPRRLSQSAAASDELLALREQIGVLRSGLDVQWLALISRSGVDCCGSQLQFEFECPMNWEDLRPTEDAMVRHCSSCQAKVYYTTSLEEGREHARRGECVCLASDVDDESQLQKDFDESRRHRRCGICRSCLVDHVLKLRSCMPSGQRCEGFSEAKTLLKTWYASGTKGRQILCRGWQAPEKMTTSIAGQKGRYNGNMCRPFRPCSSRRSPPGLISPGKGCTCPSGIIAPPSGLETKQFPGSTSFTALPSGQPLKVRKHRRNARFSEIRRTTRARELN